MNIPRARREGLRVKEVVDGRLAVYDEYAQQGHLLGPVCAGVFRLADGTRTWAELAVAVEGADAASVAHALAELRSARLLDAMD